MPRKRQGTGAGGNRVDTLTKPQPVTTPTGLAYGEAQQLHDTQQAVPLAGDPHAALQAATATQPPPPIHAPTDRPNEPLTTGLSSGPGLGPAAVGLAPNPAVNTLKAVAAQYGHNNPQLLALLAMAEQG